MLRFKLNNNSGSCPNVGDESSNNAKISFWTNVSQEVWYSSCPHLTFYTLTSDAAFAPNIPSCIYYISLTEYNMTSAPSFMPSSLNNYGRQKKVLYVHYLSFCAYDCIEKEKN